MPPPEPRDATLQLLKERSERLIIILGWLQRGDDLGPNLLDDVVRAVGNSVRQYQRERAVDSN